MPNDTVLSDEVLSELERDVSLTQTATFPMTTEQVRALCATVRVLRVQVAQCEQAFELDAALKLSEVGNLNALQIIRKMAELHEQNTALREQLAQCTIELERESREMQKWNNRANQLAIEGQDLRRQLAQAESLAETRSDLIAAKAAHVDKLQSQLAQVTAERDELQEQAEVERKAGNWGR